MTDASLSRANKPKQFPDKLETLATMPPVRNQLPLQHQLSALDGVPKAKRDAQKIMEDKTIPKWLQLTDKAEAAMQLHLDNFGPNAIVFQRTKEDQGSDHNQYGE